MAMDYADLAAKFGGTEEVAQTRGQPSMSDLSLKDQHLIRKQENTEGRKRLADLSMDISNARGIVDDLNEFHRLNLESSTGSWWQQLTPDKDMFRNKQSIEMTAIQSRLGPSQRVQGSGSSSDRDVNLFLRGIPSTENIGSVNAGIREDFQRKYDYANKKRTAMQGYFDQYGSLNGFDTAWGDRGDRQPSAAPVRPVSNVPETWVRDANGRLVRQ